MKTARIAFVLGCAVFLTGANGYCQDLKADYEKLQKELAKVTADRDNMVLQSKNLLECSQRFTELEAKYTTLLQEREQVKKDLQKARDEAALLTQTTAEQKDAARGQVKEMQDKVNQLVQDNNNLKNSLEKAQIEYKMVPEMKREIARTQSEKKEIGRKNTQLDQRVKRLEADRLDKEAQITVYRKQIVEAKKRYEQAMAKNRVFEKKAEQLPVKFTEIARENKVLIKETALMHYNLGVFYTKNKEYPRAIAEFEKAKELNPDDPYVHFNLGYIYAEYLVDRPKAIANFRKYLSLLKTDDKDADWVKKYILTWQTWDAKKPVD